MSTYVLKDAEEMDNSWIIFSHFGQLKGFSGSSSQGSTVEVGVCRCNLDMSESVLCDWSMLRGDMMVIFAGCERSQNRSSRVCSTKKKATMAPEHAASTSVLIFLGTGQSHQVHVSVGLGPTTERQKILLGMVLMKWMLMINDMILVLLSYEMPEKVMRISAPEKPPRI